MHLISTDPSCEKTSNQALFEDSVNLQSKICPHFRTVFAVAKLGSPPYCGEALRNEKFSLHHTNYDPLGNSRQQSNFRNTNSTKATNLFHTQFDLREATGSQTRASPQYGGEPNLATANTVRKWGHFLIADSPNLQRELGCWSFRMMGLLKLSA